MVVSALNVFGDRRFVMAWASSWSRDLALIVVLVYNSVYLCFRTLTVGLLWSQRWQRLDYKWSTQVLPHKAVKNGDVISYSWLFKLSSTMNVGDKKTYIGRDLNYLTEGQIISVSKHCMEQSSAWYIVNLQHLQQGVLFICLFVFLKVISRLKTLRSILRI